MSDQPAGTDDATSGAPAASSDAGRGEVRHVPADGVDVWDAPDGTQAPIGSLPGGTEVTVVGRRGQWVHVHAEDGFDGWADGSSLAGIAVGAAPVGTASSPAAAPASRLTGGSVVVEKQRGPFLIATGPVIGALGALVAMGGAALSWRQGPDTSAFDIPMRFLSGWQHVLAGGFSLGALVVILGAVGVVVSLVGGGGILRRILGLALIIVCVVYVLQWQDFLNSDSRGIGTGVNVWDIVDYGVLVTFGGGIVMLVSPSR